MKLLYHGFLNSGGTARQRFEAFAALPGVSAVPLDLGVLRASPDLASKVRWKLRWPPDEHRQNERLLSAVATEKPDIVFIDNSRVITRETLRKVRKLCDPLLVYYSPDDIIAPHNLSWITRFTFPDWDVFFTTKTYNVSELAKRGVRNPVLAGNAFDPALHRPMTREEVGEDYEKFDLVFVGTFERARFRSIALLAEAGLSIAVYGNPAGALGGNWTHLTNDRVRVGPAISGLNYTRHLHHGKVALCFLRKANRDLITTRSIEIPAMRRPMLAEKTIEHDRHFIDRVEYAGFDDDQSLVELARRLVCDASLRSRIAVGGHGRCLGSGYSVHTRATEMMAAINAARGFQNAA